MSKQSYMLGQAAFIKVAYPDDPSMQGAEAENQLRQRLFTEFTQKFPTAKPGEIMRLVAQITDRAAGNKIFTDKQVNDPMARPIVSTVANALPVPKRNAAQRQVYNQFRSQDKAQQESYDSANAALQANHQQAMERINAERAEVDAGEQRLNTVRNPQNGFDATQFTPQQRATLSQSGIRGNYSGFVNKPAPAIQHKTRMPRVAPTNRNYQVTQNRRGVTNTNSQGKSYEVGGVAKNKAGQVKVDKAGNPQMLSDDQDLANIYKNNKMPVPDYLKKKL